MFKGWVILFAIAICYSFAASAQSVRGKVIYVSSKPVKFKFGSRIVNYSFIEHGQAGLFKIDVSGKKNLSIRSAAGDFRTANLVIAEGSNSHLFILKYKEPLDASVEELYDLSSTEKLTDEVQKLKMVLNNESAREAFGKQTVSIPVYASENSTAVDIPEQPQNVNTLPANTRKDSVATTNTASATNPTSSNNTATSKKTPQSVKLSTETSNASKAEPPVVKSAPAPTHKQIPVNISTNETKNPTGPGKAPTTTPTTEKTTTPTTEKTAMATTENIPASAPVPEETNSYDAYERLVHLGDSTAWTARNYKGALRWYDSARKVNPIATYPRKQIAAVKQIINDQALAARDKRSERFKVAMADYKAAEVLRVERKFEEAHKAFSKFLSQIDTAYLSEYLSSELHYINEAKDYLARLELHFERQRNPEVVAPPPPAVNGKKKKRNRN